MALKQSHILISLQVRWNQRADGMNAYQQAMRHVLLHRDAGTEMSAQGIVARLRAMVVEPPDTAAALEQIHLEGPLPLLLEHTPEGLPCYAADAVATYLGVEINEVRQALESVPAEERPLELG